MNNEPTETGIIKNDNLLLSMAFLSLDKASLTEVAMATADSYLDGFKSTVTGLMLAKKLADFAELLKNNLADAAANELKLAKGEKRVVNGATITEQMTGVRYDYASTGDKEWIELNAKLKEREKFLRGITGSITLVDDDSGEVYTVSEPIKIGKMSLIVKY